MYISKNFLQKKNFVFLMAVAVGMFFSPTSFASADSFFSEENAGVQILDIFTEGLSSVKNNVHVGMKLSLQSYFSLYKETGKEISKVKESLNLATPQLAVSDKVAVAKEGTFLC